MKVNFYLDKPYNPDISPEKVKQELAKVGGKKKFPETRFRKDRKLQIRIKN